MIELFCHKNSDQIWVSNHEYNQLWNNDRLKEKIWQTRDFINTLESISSQPFFKISEYDSNSKNGYYTIFYGRSQDIEEHLGFIILDPEIVKKVNSGNLKLLIVFVHETFDHCETFRSWSWNLGKVLTKLGIFRENSCIVFTSTKSWVTLNRWDNRYSIIYYPWFEADFQFSIKQHNRFIPDINFSSKSKIFINLNLAPRPHRYLLVMYLIFLKIHDHGNLSWLDPNELSWNELTLFHDSSYQGFQYNRDLALCQDFFYFVDLFKKIPRRELDVINQDQGHNCWTGAEVFYHQSFSELVSETHYDLPGYSFLTEKSFKPIFYGLPFIINGPQYNLKALQELGYYTFPELFNEDYDAEPASVKKILQVGDELKNLCYDENKLNYLKSPELLEKLKYNQQLFWNKNHGLAIHDLLEQTYNQ